MAVCRSDYWDFIAVQRGEALVNPPDSWTRLTITGGGTKAALRGVEWARSEDCVGEYAWVLVPLNLLADMEGDTTTPRQPKGQVLFFAFSDKHAAFEFKIRFG